MTGRASCLRDPCRRRGLALAGIGVAAFALSCTSDADGLLVITVSADAPIAGIQQLHVKLTDKTNAAAPATARIDVPQAPESPYTIPPARTMSVVLAPAIKTLDIEIEARDGAGNPLASGNQTGAAAPGSGGRKDVAVTLRASVKGDGGPDTGGVDAADDIGSDGSPGERPQDGPAPDGPGSDLRDGPDLTPPTSRATPDGGKYTAPLSVTLTSTEPGAIHYTLNGAPPTQASPRFTAPIALTTKGMHTIRFRAWDTAGTPEAQVNTEIYELGDPPAVTRVSPMSGGAGTTVTVTGRGLETVTVVLVGGSDGVAGRITSQTPAEVKFTVPPDAFSGPIAIRNQYGDTLYRDPATGGFKMGNCLEGGVYTDVLPDPGDGAVFFEGPWTGYYAVPSQSGAEIRMFKGLASTPSGRIDLSDLPGGGTVQSVDWVYLGTQKGRIAVVRRTAAGESRVSFVTPFGALVSEIPFSRFTSEPNGFGITQITNGLDAGKLAVLTPTRVFLIDDTGAASRNFAVQCAASVSGIGFIYEAPSTPPKGSLAVACGANIRIMSVFGVDGGVLPGKVFMKGIATIPGSPPGSPNVSPDWFVWLEDNVPARSRVVHVELLDGSAPLGTVDVSGLGVSSDLYMGFATLYDANYKATEMAAVQAERIVRFGLDGKMTSITRLAAGAGTLSAGAAAVTRGPGVGVLSVLDAVTRKVHFYNLSNGTRGGIAIDVNNYVKPASAVEGLMFHPTILTPDNGAFGLLNQTEGNVYLLEQNLSTKGGIPLATPNAYTSVAHVLDASGAGYGYVAALNGRNIELRNDRSATANVIPFGCQVDVRGEIAGGPIGDRRLAVFDYQDGRIDWLDLKAAGF